MTPLWGLCNLPPSCSLLPGYRIFKGKDKDVATQPELPAYVAVEPDPTHKRAMRIMRGCRTRQEKLFDSLEELISVVGHLRTMGCVIVLTMGTWDLFHGGHADYIELGKLKARELYPDAEEVIMVVAVDTDELTRARKGPRRPIVNEGERAKIISHLESVDAVIFERELSYLHRRLPHDVRVISTTTGIDVDEETTRYCAHLVNLPPQAETSTSARIRLLFVEGGQEVLGKLQKMVEELKDAFGL